MSSNENTLINSTHLSSECIRHCKSRGYPAESVNYMRRQSTDDTLYRLPHILGRCYDHRTCQKQDSREDIVQPEHSIVRSYRLVLEVHAQTT